jgi:hypothetical protein
MGKLRLMNVVFTSALFLGTAAIACWVVVRFPRIAPGSVLVRSAGALASAQLLGVINVSSETTPKLYVSVFVLLLPALTVMWTCTVWLLQSLQEALGAMR